MVIVALGGTSCDRCLRGLSIAVAPSFMVESVAAMSGGKPETASEVRQGEPLGRCHETIATSDMIPIG